jgi:hypothetical protein
MRIRLSTTSMPWIVARAVSSAQNQSDTHLGEFDDLFFLRSVCTLKLEN